MAATSLRGKKSGSIRARVFSVDASERVPTALQLVAVIPADVVSALRRQPEPATPIVLEVHEVVTTPPYTPDDANFETGAPVVLTRYSQSLAFADLDAMKGWLGAMALRRGLSPWQGARL